jgi:hypothetical protein
MTEVNDLRQTCFFCAQRIESNKDRSREHIVPDFLLQRMDIKRETISGDSKREYAKVKVPAHSACNSGFASAYENQIKVYLDDLDSLSDALTIKDDSIPLDYGPDDSAASIVSTWLSKIFYGLFYFDLATSRNPEWRDVCASVVSSKNFELVRRSYQQGHGFCLPSTLYAFRSNCAQRFDLRTSAAPEAILVKVDSLVLVLAIADGFLTKQYLRDTPLEVLRTNIKTQEDANADFPGYLLAWAEILALRVCIPKSPQFMFSDDRVTNMSLATMASNPEELYRIDEEWIGVVRDDIHRQLRIIIPK